MICKLRTYIYKFLITACLFLPFFAFGQKYRCYNLRTVLNTRPPPLYRSHLQTAKGFGIRILENNTQIQRYVKQKKLSKVTAGQGFTIYRLTHSRPYLVPRAKRILREMGQKFYQRSRKKTFTVTSVTRTLEDQCRLRRVNRNATLGASSHNYGCSFDISYIRFSGRKAPNARLEKALQAVLVQYQRAGKIYFIKERSQSCFHVTVRS